MEVLKISKNIDSNDNSLGHFTSLNPVSVSLFFFPFPQEFILSEDYNKMTLVKSYQGKNHGLC